MSDEPEKKPDGEPDKEPTKLSFSLPQLLGSAAAAATVAYVGSSLGTAGTIFGAALASVIGALAGTVYTAGLDRTGRRLGSVMSRGWERIRSADPALEDEQATVVLEPDDTLVEPGIGPSEPEEPVRDRATTWRRIGLRVLAGAAAIFAVTFVVITGLELIRGQALDGGEGTTLGQVVRPERQSSAEPEPTASETPTPTETATPTPSETPTEPSATPTPTPTPTPTETPEPSPTSTVVTPVEPEPTVTEPTATG